MSKLSYSEEYKDMLTRLKEARLKAGLSQADVAGQLKKPQSYISKVEAGERRLDVIELKRLAKIYKINTSALIS